MVSKPRRTNKKDSQQDKRIAKLERQFPTVKEVVNNKASVTLTDTTKSKVYSLLPDALNNEKVEFTGYDYKGFIRYTSGTGSTVAPPNSHATYRVIMLLYKCNVDPSGSTVHPTAPVIEDILNDNADGTLANYNAQNTRRMRVIFDKRGTTSDINLNYLLQQSRKYKRSISFMPTVDRAFVMRPYLVVVGNYITDTTTFYIEHDIDIHTRQNPV